MRPATNAARGIITKLNWNSKHAHKIGRIAAQVYNPESTPIGASRAQFGTLDAVDDIEVTRALIQVADDWLRARGADRINGSFSPTINGECGVLVEGFDATPMIFMPWNPPYLARHLEALGYEKARDLISYRFDITDFGLDEKPRGWRDQFRCYRIPVTGARNVDQPSANTDLGNAYRFDWKYTRKPHCIDEVPIDGTDRNRGAMARVETRCVKSEPFQWRDPNNALQRGNCHTSQTTRRPVGAHKN